MQTKALSLVIFFTLFTLNLAWKPSVELDEDPELTFFSFWYNYEVDI